MKLLRSSAHFNCPPQLHLPRLSPTSHFTYAVTIELVMDETQLRRLPDELIEAVVFYLPPDATLAFGTTCKNINKIAYEHLVWRRHCMQTWRYWEPKHELCEILQQPPAQVKWRHLYNERRRTDNVAADTFEELLKTQQKRVERMEDISGMGYDVKELLMQIRDETPDDAEDVLARRYWAEAILAQIHRHTAVEKWHRLSRKQMVRLEEVLGAYDLFVLAGRRGDLNDIDTEFDRIAKAIRQRDPDFDDLSVRQKAVQIARWLRSEELVGNPDEENYHALRNNFISIALFDEVHTSLPLQSVSIYCAVARRLGVNAKPSNYPHHVHAVIEAPQDQTLDGKGKISTSDDSPEIMHMDPWRSSDEVPTDQLRLRLSQMGAPAHAHANFLGATSTLDIVLRAGRNIMNSVQEARERAVGGMSGQPTFPDIEAAWYAMLWSMLILGDSNGPASSHRRRQCLPYLAEHFQSHFPEDLSLVENMILPMFHGEREHHVLTSLVTTLRTADRNAKAPNPRSQDANQNVTFKVGHVFQHKRYGYEAFIVGWDYKCSADDQWIQRMRVDTLPKGREQPFYNVV